VGDVFGPADMNLPIDFPLKRTTFLGMDFHAKGMDITTTNFTLKKLFVISTE
jgi:hypothetical protein